MLPQNVELSAWKRSNSSPEIISYFNIMFRDQEIWNNECKIILDVLFFFSLAWKSVSCGVRPLRFPHPVSVATGEPCCYGNVCFPLACFLARFQYRGEAAWMISSLQQLHTAARQTRNFLWNFQVAFRRETPGHFQSPLAGARITRRHGTALPDAFWTKSIWLWGGKQHGKPCGVTWRKGESQSVTWGLVMWRVLEAPLRHQFNCFFVFVLVWPIIFKTTLLLLCHIFRN